MISSELLRVRDAVLLLLREVEHWGLRRRRSDCSRDIIGLRSGWLQVTIGLSSGGNRAAIGLPSGCHRAAIGLSSGWHRAGIGLPSGCHRAAIGLPSGCHWAVIRLPSGCYWAVIGLASRHIYEPTTPVEVWKAWLCFKTKETDAHFSASSAPTQNNPP